MLLGRKQQRTTAVNADRAECAVPSAVCGQLQVQVRRRAVAADLRAECSASEAEQDS